MNGTGWHIRLLSLLFLLSSLYIQAQQKQLNGRVVDAETGDPLPYVTIYLGPGRGTLTNEEGEYMVKVEANDSVSFSCIGYEKLLLPVSGVQFLTKMKAIPIHLKELTVQAIPYEDVIKKTIKNVKSSYKRGKKNISPYFWRSSISNGKETELVEAFLKARSAVNLRFVELLSGIKGTDAEGNKSNLNILRTNMPMLMTTGPITFEDRWQYVLKPLKSIKDVRKYYQVEGCLLTGEKGEKLYKLDFTHNNQLPPITEEMRHRMLNGWEWKIFEGSVYVDAEDFHLVSFRGGIKNIYQKVDGKDRQPIDVKIGIDYDYAQGYCEISKLTVLGGTESMNFRSLLYKMEDPEMMEREGSLLSYNLADDIEAVGHDSAMWSKYDIVKRTAEEERIAFGESPRGKRPGERELASEDSSQIERGTFADSIVENLRLFEKSYPQEKVYVHMDNDCYFLGDTIRYAAHLSSASNHSRSNLSKILYVELLNEEGYLVERQIVRAERGHADGCFVLNNPVQYAGYYELRAYTRWQLNWGCFERKHSQKSREWFIDREAEHEYFRDYDKLYSRVFPVYDKPSKQGDYDQVMSRRILRRQYKPEERKLLLSFFPEGGNLVAGVENRVAFEAAWSDGEWVEGTLQVDSSAKAETKNRGRGVFTVVPEKGQEREVEFVTRKGERIRAKLPVPEGEGLSVEVLQRGESLQLKTRPSVSGVPDSLAVSLMHGGKLEVLRTMSPRGEGSTVEFDTSTLAAGIHQLTVFDAAGRVWADRLFFVRKADTHQPTLECRGMRDEYQPYENIALTFASPSQSGKAGGTQGTSVSIREQTFPETPFDNGGILTELLLCSEIKGFVPHPGWYFEKDDEEHRQALDLLMMTQGWRRFDWKSMAVKGAWEPTQPCEQSQHIMGRVLRGNNNTEYFKSPSPSSNQDDFTDLEGILKKRRNEGQTRNERFDTSEDKSKRKDGREEPEEEKLAKYVDVSIENNSPTETLRDYRKEKLKGEVLVHVELEPIRSKKALFMNIDTDEQGKFHFAMPKSYGVCQFFLTACDTVEADSYEFIMPREVVEYTEDVGARTGNQLISYAIDNAKYRVRVSHPYPHFVSPYNFYQKHLMKGVPKESPLRLEDVTVMDELEVSNRRRGSAQFDDSQPTLMVLSYEAYNDYTDAGLTHADNGVVRYFIGDMGLEAPYKAGPNGTPDYGIRKRLGLGKTRRTLPQYVDIPKDSIYHRKYLHSFPETIQFSPDEMRDYSDMLEKTDRYVLYTDYIPRCSDKSRYEGSNLPETSIVTYPYPDGSEQIAYRDRRYFLPGMSIANDFYHPDYSQHKLPEGQKDYRRTLYWNPNLQLDEKGEAHISFYNNSRTTKIVVDAEGQAADGTLLWYK